MNVSVHFITSLILATSIYFQIGIYSIWIMVGGWLIDFDHYIWTIYKLKSLSLKESYYYHFNRHTDCNYEKDLLHIFHTYEFWIFMILATIISSKMNNLFFYYMFLITSIGMLLHLSLDFTMTIRKKHLDARAISLIRWIKRNKIKHP